jgi:hypothetical protein
MIYGDGEELFGRMTKCLDVVGHELTHGITQYSAGLPYEGQSGELDSSTRQALDELLEQKPTATAAGRVPDGFVYSFEMDDAGATKKAVEVNGTHIPDSLRKLLP